MKNRSNEPECKLNWWNEGREDSDRADLRADARRMVPLFAFSVLCLTAPLSGVVYNTRPVDPPARPD